MKNKEYYNKLFIDISICFFVFGLLILSATFFINKKYSEINELSSNSELNSEQKNPDDNLVLPIYLDFKSENSLTKWDNQIAGQVLYKNNSIVLNSYEDVSSEMILKNSYDLENYIWQLKGSLIKGTKVSLISNYTDEKNYSMCTFDNIHVRIFDVKNGEKKELAVVRNNNSLAGDLSLSMTSNYNNIKCYVGAKMIIGTSDSQNKKGSIGVLVYKNSEISIDKISIHDVDKGKDFLLDIKKINNNYNQVQVLNNASSTKNNLNNVLISTTSIDKNENQVIKNKPLLFKVNNESVSYNLGNIPAVNWKIAIGKLSTSTSNLIIGDIETPLSIIYLDGAFSWDNYRADVIVDWGRGISFSLIAKYDNSKDYVSCAFINYGRTVGIYGYRDGEMVKRMISGELPVSYYPVWLNNKYGMEVKDGTITCFIDGEMIMRSTIPKGLNEGSFGFSMVEPGKNGGANIKIKSLSVTSLK